MMLYFLGGILLLYILVSAVFAYFGICFGSIRTSDTSYFSENGASARHPFRDRIEPEARAIYKMPHEDRYLTSYDGLKLHAALYRAENAKGLVICVHGFHSRAEKDFSSLFSFYRQQHFHILLVDQRAHMESEGKYACYGAAERYDLRDWIADIAAVFGADFPIWLHGESMGAATCMMVSDLPMHGNVRGIIDDSGFDTPEHEMKYIYTTNFHFPAYPGIWFIALFFRLFGHASIYRTTAIRSLRRTTIPCLFIHGTEDDVVPLQYGLNAYHACASEKELWVVEDAGHCAAYWADEDGYQKRLSAFLGRTAPNA